LLLSPLPSIQLISCPPIASIPEPQRAVWLKYQAVGFKDKDEFEKEVVRHVETTLARSMFNCDETAAYAATSLALRDRLVLEWNKTQQRQTLVDGKRVYYLSLEFLMGRALDNAMLNVGLKDVAKCKHFVPNGSVRDG
jgi:glycogen phosphorylase